MGAFEEVCHPRNRSIRRSSWRDSMYRWKKNGTLRGIVSQHTNGVKIHSVNSFKGRFTLTGATSKVFIKSMSRSWVESLRMTKNETEFYFWARGRNVESVWAIGPSAAATMATRDLGVVWWHRLQGQGLSVHPTPTSCRPQSFLCFRFAIWMGAGNGWKWTSVFCRVSVYIVTVLSHFTFKYFYHKNNIHWL